MQKIHEAHILTLNVDNEFGVLTRITAQIRREGWNIKSLAVAETLDPALSRITLALECFDTTLPAAMHRLSRLTCVREIKAYDGERQICRELMVVGVPAGKKPETESAGLSPRFLGTIGSLDYYEYTGYPKELTKIAAQAQVLGEIKVVRTGPIVIE